MPVGIPLRRAIGMKTSKKYSTGLLCFPEELASPFT
jgi:hypothetical protein